MILLVINSGIISVGFTNPVILTISQRPTTYCNQNSRIFLTQNTTFKLIHTTQNTSFVKLSSALSRNNLKKKRKNFFYLSAKREIANNFFFSFNSVNLTDKRRRRSEEKRKRRIKEGGKDHIGVAA